jgi:hypothetical protein
MEDQVVGERIAAPVGELHDVLTPSDDFRLTVLADVGLKPQRVTIACEETFIGGKEEDEER